ncbi:MAG: amidase domain-containing protein [Syntrophomonadaceae bacterium]|jgi:hypothetical protein
MVLAMVLVLSIGCLSASAEEVGDLATETAIKFVDTTFSDFADPENYKEDLIATNADELKQFIQDKRKIMNLKQELSGRKIVLQSREILDTKVTKLDDSYEVLLDINYIYTDGDLKSSLNAGYKIILGENNLNEFKVIAAMSNDLSSGSLINATIAQPAADLNLDFQLNTQMKASYDCNTVEEKIKNYFEDVKKENEGLIAEDTEDNKSVQSFHTFTSSERAGMRTYQDNWWNGFNPAYANFTDWGGDCTNYASQVLHDGGGSPFYPSPNTGISGSDRWFYRSSNDRSSSWTGVEELQTFLLNNTTKGPSGQVNSTYGSLNSGDIIQLSSSGEYYHSIVVHTPGGDPTVTAHTSAYSGYYSTRYGGISNIKIHVTGYYN